MVKQEEKVKLQSRLKVVPWGRTFIVIDEDKSLIGKIGICSNGIKGKITGRKMLPWGLSWVGVTVDTGAPWASRNPTIVEGGNNVQRSGEATHSKGTGEDPS